MTRAVRDISNEVVTRVNQLSKISGTAKAVGLKEMHLPAITDVVANGLIAGPEVHVALLALATEPERAVWIPVVSIAPLFAGAASEKENERVLRGGTNAPLSLAAVLVVQMSPHISLARLKHPRAC